MNNLKIPKVRASKWSGLSTVAQADLVREKGGRLIVTWHGKPLLYVATPKPTYETTDA